MWVAEEGKGGWRVWRVMDTGRKSGSWAKVITCHRRRREVSYVQWEATGEYAAVEREASMYILKRFLGCCLEIGSFREKPRNKEAG